MRIILPQTIPILLDRRPQGVVLSPSQISTWDLCHRRWAFEYILKIRPPPNASAQLGTEVHKHLENWLRHATPPPNTKSGDIARSMIKNLPPPGSGFVERRFYFQTALGHYYTGFIDLLGVFDFPTVTDHKTTGDIEKYGKTEADLHNDVQALIYSVAGFIGFRTDTLQLFWNYGETKKRRNRYNTKIVKTLVHLPVVQQKFENVIEPTAAEILWHYGNQTDPHSFPPTVSACGAYGGCPHRHRCKISDQERMDGLMTTPGQGQGAMADRLAAYNGNGVQQQPGFAPQQQQMQPQQMQPQGYPPQQQQMPQQQMQPPMTQPMMQPQMPGMQQAPLSPPLPNYPPPAAQSPQQAQQAQQAQQGGQPPYSPEQGPNPPESTQGAATPAAEPTKRGPGRPPGVKNKTLNAEQQLFMMGVTAAMQAGQTDPSILAQAGDLAISVFTQKFG